MTSGQIIENYYILKLMTIFKKIFFYVGHFKSFYYFCFMIFFFFCGRDYEACEVSTHWPGVNSALPALEDEVLTTGSPRKSLNFLALQ